MRRGFLSFSILVCVSLLCAGISVRAQAPDKSGDEAAIRVTLSAQVAAWNRADVDTFMQGYENSPETTFVGAAVRKGYQPILEHYRASYANAAQMGTLTFSNLDVRLLPSSSGTAEYALVTGNFHLERKEKGTAAKDDGIFSLVWHRTAQGWKIILDHSS